jgi:hypothetical protein
MDQPHTGQRVWRLRKANHSVDAELRALASDEVLVQFLYDGALTYEHRWPTSAEALAEIAERRAELERSGWIPHW